MVFGFEMRVTGKLNYGSVKKLTWLDKEQVYKRNDRIVIGCHIKVNY